MNIETVTIVGANGNMGKNVAGIVAGFGNCKVFLISRSIEKSTEAIESICRSIKSDRIKKQLIPKDYSDLEACVRDSDWVFESVAEDIAVKMDLTKAIFSYSGEKTIVSTGTSGLSISEIAKEIPKNKRSLYFGTHFFNPPYNLNLCELVETEFVDQQLVTKFAQYLEENLLRTIVRVKDKPAFLANRVGFHFINRACHLANDYKSAGGIDYIDYLFQGVTGRSMPPLLTADFVGLDVHVAIIDNLKENTADYCNEVFRRPKFLEDLLTKGLLGRKAGGGLYRQTKSDTQLKTEVYDIVSGGFREKRRYNIPLIENMKKQIRLGNYLEAYQYLIQDSSQEGCLLKDLLTDNAVYSYYVSNELADNTAAVDKAMVNGFNWCAPSSWLEIFGGQDNFEAVYQQSAENQVSKQEFTGLVESVFTAEFDFRKFIKA
ncbi:3-hydroxyacyl-CoA dehydrogenase family protein [Enterococcus sp. LJL128]